MNQEENITFGCSKEDSSSVSQKDLSRFLSEEVLKVVNFWVSTQVKFDTETQFFLTNTQSKMCFV